MKALISANEARADGVRVAQVSAASFDVASPLYWVDCPVGVKSETHYFKPSTATFPLLPIEPGAI